MRSEIADQRHVARPAEIATRVGIRDAPRVTRRAEGRDDWKDSHPDFCNTRSRRVHCAVHGPLISLSGNGLMTRLGRAAGRSLSFEISSYVY